MKKRVKKNKTRRKSSKSRPRKCPTCRARSPEMIYHMPDGAPGFASQVFGGLVRCHHEWHGRSWI